MSAERLRRALQSLDGLSVGDAFGQRFFTDTATVAERISLRTLPPAPWQTTDDTAMALSIVDVLAEHDGIDRDRLAERFAARFVREPWRGYGSGAHEILGRLARGEAWTSVAPGVFGGTGSMGNGGAMRAAPIGAWFADDVPRAALEARRSAEVTHAHPEGQAGAIAVSVAAAWVAAGAGAPAELFATVLAHMPPGATRTGIVAAAALSAQANVQDAVGRLGNGERVTAQDTVPFTLWCIARHPGAYEDALWTTVSGLGDRDTTCAIVGGILAADPAVEIPADWLRAREPLER
ncbi:MAG: ADP-ribosylglycohydrolase family protein [Candidatus Eisenbacteria bacterium]